MVSVCEKIRRRLVPLVCHATRLSLCLRVGEVRIVYFPSPIASPWSGSLKEELGGESPLDFVDAGYAAHAETAYKNLGILTIACLYI